MPFYGIGSETTTSDNHLQYSQILLLLAALSFAIKPTSAYSLLPIALSISWFLRDRIHWHNVRFWLFLFWMIAFASINLLKNYLIFQNPIFPFANDLFQSPYWDRFTSEELKLFFRLMGGHPFQFFTRIPSLYLGNLSCLLFLVVSLYFVWKQRSHSFTLPEKKLLQIVTTSWLAGLSMWVLLLPPTAYLRFLTGFVLLTMLLPLLWGLLFWKHLIWEKKEIWLSRFALLSLFLSLSVSHLDIDLKRIVTLFKPDSYFEQWVQDNGLAELYAYLNQHSQQEESILFYESKRFHTHLKVYPVSRIRQQTRGLYSTDPSVIFTTIRRLKPQYYAIHKQQLTSLVPIETKEFLDQHFLLMKDFPDYLLYRIPTAHKNML